MSDTDALVLRVLRNRQAEGKRLCYMMFIELKRLTRLESESNK